MSGGHREFFFSSFHQQPTNTSTHQHKHQHQRRFVRYLLSSLSFRFGNVLSSDFLTKVKLICGVVYRLKIVLGSYMTNLIVPRLLKLLDVMIGGDLSLEGMGGSGGEQGGGIGGGEGSGNKNKRGESNIQTFTYSQLQQQLQLQLQLQLLTIISFNESQTSSR